MVFIFIFYLGHLTLYSLRYAFLRNLIFLRKENGFEWNGKIFGKGTVRSQGGFWTYGDD